MSVAELVQASGVAFGTSGARGPVSAMTDQVCHGYAAGFLAYLTSQGLWKSGDRVALAGDLRPSTPHILAACALAVEDLGGKPVFCGFVPTPALACYAISEGIPAIMVTGSHIPDDRNGIKFYRPDGEILKHEEPHILGQRVRPRQWNASGEAASLPALTLHEGIGAAYVRRYVDYFGPDCLSGACVGVYQHSAVGRDILVDVLEGLGAEAVALGRSDLFIPVDTEAVREEDIALARDWASQHRLDAIVSTDGDSDRPLVADETGEWLRGDVLAMLCAHVLGMQTVITPVSSNTVAEQSGFFARVERTRIGSPYVVAAMQAAQANGETLVCGYEANGGFLLGSDVTNQHAALAALPTRDAVLPIIAILVAARGSSIRKILSELPGRFTFSNRIANFAPDRSGALMAWMTHETEGDDRLNQAFGRVAGAALSDVNRIDGVRLTFANGQIIHLRQSGNAPELRCYAEAEDQLTARTLAGETLALIEQRF
jgi:phosphomannomutase